MTASTLSFAGKSFTHDPGEMALVVVDLTRHAARDGRFARALRERGIDSTEYFDRIEHAVVPNTLRLIDGLRAGGGVIAFTKLLIESDDATDWPPAYRNDVLALGLAPSRPGTDDYELLEPLRAEPNDLIIGKRSVSAFCNTDLGSALEARRIRHVVLTGCTTNFGVGVTAVDAANRGFEVTVIDDACAALTTAAHDEWLAMHKLFLQRATTQAFLQHIGA